MLLITCKCLLTLNGSLQHIDLLKKKYDSMLKEPVYLIQSYLQLKYNFPTFSSFFASCFFKKPVISMLSFSARYSWLVSSSLARANFLQASRYCTSDWSVTCNLSSHRAALALAFSISDSLSAFDSCLPSFFPFLWQNRKSNVLT